MRRRVLIIVGAVIALALAAGGGAIATGQSVPGLDNDDVSATGPEADRASAAAVEAAGGGKVTEVERDPEGNRVWKVEVVKENGVVSDVELDADYQVVPPPPDDADDHEADEVNDDDTDDGDND